MNYIELKNALMIIFHAKKENVQIKTYNYRLDLTIDCYNEELIS